MGMNLYDGKGTYRIIDERIRIMMFDIVEALYYILPAAALIFFGVSLFRYLFARHKNKQNSDAYSPGQMKSRKICLIAASVIAGSMAAVVIAFIGLLMLAVSFM